MSKEPDVTYSYGSPILNNDSSYWTEDSDFIFKSKKKKKKSSDLILRWA